MSKFKKVAYSALVGTAILLVSLTSTAQDRAATTKATRDSTETAARRIAYILAQPLRRRLDYHSEQLDIIFNEMQEEYGIPIVFDKSALDEVAISPEAEVSISLDKISLQAALSLMFKEPGLEELTFTVDNEVLLITTKEHAREIQVTKVYRADDFELTNVKRSRAFMGASAWADFSPMIDVITSCIEPDSWNESGKGDGEIRFVKPDMLVITQSWRVHRQIEKMFEDLRQTKHIVLGETNDANLSLEPETHGFAINLELGKNPEQVQQKLVDSIKKSVEWSTKNVPEEETWIEVLPNRVLVRHIPQVLSQVEGVLINTRLLYIPHVPAKGLGQGGGRGGGGGAF